MSALRQMANGSEAVVKEMDSYGKWTGGFLHKKASGRERRIRFMQNLTKYALEDSLKKLLLKKPLDKITINDLTSDCGISRMAFYYHFKDIYDLVEWACIEDATRALQGKKTYATWQEGLLQIFEVVQENKPFILNVYRCVSREQIENYLFSLTYGLIAGVVEEQAVRMDVPKEEREFIAHFYKYSFVGVMLDWIRRGMKEEPRELAEKICITMHGNIIHSLENAEAAAKGELKIFQ